MEYVSRISTIFLIFAASGEVLLKEASVYSAIKAYDLAIWIAISIAGGLIASGHIYAKLQKLPSKAEFVFIFCRSISIGVVVGITFQSKPVEVHVPLILFSSFGAEYIINGIFKLLEQFSFHPIKFIQEWLHYRSYLNGVRKQNVIELNLKEGDEYSFHDKKDN